MGSDSLTESIEDCAIVHSLYNQVSLLLRTLISVHVILLPHSTALFGELVDCRACKHMVNSLRLKKSCKHNSLRESLTQQADIHSAAGLA